VRDFLLGTHRQLLFGPKISSVIIQETHQSLARACGRFISWTDIDLTPEDWVPYCAFSIYEQYLSADFKDCWFIVASDSFVKYALNTVDCESGHAKYLEDIREAITLKSSSPQPNDMGFDFHGLTTKALQTLIAWKTKNIEENLPEYYTTLSSLNSLQEWTIKSLTKGKCLAEKNANERITAATHLGLTNLIQAFCEAGYSIDGRNFCGRTALHGAAIGENMMIVKLLVSKVAQVNLSDWKGKTRLFYAIRKGEIGTVMCLLSSGCATNTRDGERRTPLQEAAFRGQVEVVRALITSGADVNAELQENTVYKIDESRDAIAPWYRPQESSTDD
jgi:hypothetical protein